MTKLFDILGVRYKDRPGGYLRILKFGFRTGDTSPMALVQLVDRPDVAAVEPADATAEGSQPKKAKVAKARPVKAATAKAASAEDKPAKAKSAKAKPAKAKSAPKAKKAASAKSTSE